jgi:hypothetical protein
LQHRDRGHAACGIAVLSNFCCDYPHALTLAAGWDHGRRKTEIGTGRGYESGLLKAQGQAREARRQLEYAASQHKIDRALIKMFQDRLAPPMSTNSPVKSDDPRQQ